MQGFNCLTELCQYMPYVYPNTCYIAQQNGWTDVWLDRWMDGKVFLGFLRAWSTVVEDYKAQFFVISTKN